MQPSPDAASPRRRAAPTVDLGPQVNTAIWTLTILAGLFLGLRMFCKIWRVRKLWWDDYTLVASYVALLAACSMQAWGITLGFGRHNSEIPPGNFDDMLFWGYSSGFAAILSALWSKISFAFTLLRIVSDRKTKIFLWVIIISVNIVLGSCAAFQFAQCWPVNKLWHSETPGTCWPRRVSVKVNIGSAAYSGSMDVILSILPWTIVWRAAISKKEKMSALFAMSMGVFAGITSFLKIPTLFGIDSHDTINVVNLAIFGIAEGAITIMAVSIPILRALIWEKPPSRRQFSETELARQFGSLPSSDSIDDLKQGRR